MSSRATARFLSAIVAVLVLLQPFIRMAYSADSSPKLANAFVKSDVDRDSPDHDLAFERADRPSEAAAPVRRARIYCETVRDYLAALHGPATLLTRLAVANCERPDQDCGLASFEYFAARMHETRGKPHITVSISLSAEWISENSGQRGLRLCPKFDDSCIFPGRCSSCS